MKFKRVLHLSSGIEKIAIEINNAWRVIETTDHHIFSLLSKSASDLEKLQHSEYVAERFKELLPFKPTAYRDFMLYEAHAISAARGFVKKYLTKLWPLVYCYEKLTRKVFPKLKPKSRYYRHPIYYLGNHLNFVSEGEGISIPSYTKEIDYELELAAVIVKPLKNATVAEVNEAIGGFVIINDFTARDIQLDEMATGFGPMKSKNFATAMSATVIGKDEIIDSIDALEVKVYINEKLITTNSSANKLYSFQEAIAYASWEEQLHAGELFASGTVPTCTGIENGHLLSSGDLVTFEVEMMGRLNNTIK